MLKKALIALGVIIVGVLGLAATRPDNIRVQRTMSIKAPAAKIFPLVADFHDWTGWSPYEKRDPQMHRTYSGAAAGQGAEYEWNGNDQVGAGRMKILEATSPSRVTIQLDFRKPSEGHNVAEFTMDPQGDTTRVTWAMHGPANYFHKLVGLFFSMDSLIGNDFDAGLANLKTLAERT
jgi:uncharacterized protein YndB with AHSA1/START domain